MHRDTTWVHDRITYAHTIDAPTLEALACREPLTLADDLLARRMLVSFDCQSGVKDISEKSDGHYAAIIREVNAHAEEFDACNFIYDSRSRNFEADSLAIYSLSLDVGRHVWLIQPHDIISIPMDLFDE